MSFLIVPFSVNGETSRKYWERRKTSRLSKAPSLLAAKVYLVEKAAQGASGRRPACWMVQRKELCLGIPQAWVEILVLPPRDA